MFRFIVALLLINSYTGSWGAPTQNVPMLLSVIMNELANNCESPFLATQMKNRLKDCEVPVPPYHKKQFECLLFYDMNRRLCGAVGSSKLALTDDYSHKILAEQDVSQLCNIAKDWTFTNMSPVYNETVNSVFRDPLKCFKFCLLSSENILSVDSTFYCKYFKWGSEMLKAQTEISSKDVLDNTAIAAHASGENVSAKNEEPNPISENNEVEIEKPFQSGQDNQPKPPVTASNSKNVLNNTSSTIIANAGVIPVENKGEVSATSENQQEQPQNSSSNKKTQLEANIPAAKPPLFTNNEQQPAVPKDSVLKDVTTTTVSQNGNNKNKKEDAHNELKLATNQNNVLNQIEIQKPSNNVDPDDYQPNDPDSEEVRDGLGDTQGGDDSDDGLDTKLDEELNKKTIAINEPSIYNNDIAPKDTYSNTIPEFADEDDHFFPFFLTAIIMVILLYILYHNKNKVSKLFLGLIVEGRQPGRRRNSRGHAYRRLDTLEQAMSTSTAAPPSKIIY